jgi:hypothetical protein
MVVGTIIGASIFVQPSTVTGAVPSVVGIVAVWIIAGLLTLGGSLIAAELASAFPVTGGVYVYLTRAFSPALGFLWGWAMFWTMHTGIIAVIAMVFARYVGVLAPLSDAGLRAIAAGAIIVLSAVNYIGVRQGSGLQTALACPSLRPSPGSSRHVDFCSRSRRGCSPSAGGIWSPMPPARRSIHSIRFRARWLGVRSSSPRVMSCSTRPICTYCP